MPPILQDPKALKIKLGTTEVTEDFSELNLPETEKRKGASSLLQELPNGIPNTKAVSTIVDPKNPSVHLIIIKQTHGVDRSLIYGAISSDLKKSGVPDRDIPGKVIDQLTAPDFIKIHNDRTQKATLVQKDIVEIVNYFSKNHDIHAIYGEGLTLAQGPEKNEPSFAIEKIEEAKRELPQAEKLQDEAITRHLKLQELLKPDSSLTPEKRQILNRNIPGAYYDVLKKMKSVDDLEAIVSTSSSARIQAEGLAIYPTESSEVFNAAKKLEVGQEKILMNAREDVVLQVVTAMEQNGDRVAILTYGSDHDFKDNVMEYNKTHADKIKLTVITPESL